MSLSSSSKQCILITLLISIFFVSKAQIDLSHRFTYEEFDTNATGNLYFRLENNNFVKNNEYFGEYTEGYTLPGYSIQPSLMYYAGNKVRIKIGSHLVKYSGTNNFTEVVPVVSAHVKIGKNWDMVLGSIKGHVHHKLIEPLFSSDWQYFVSTETGAQFYHNTSKLWLDTWVDWEQFIFKGDTIPEIFTAGLSLDYQISDADAALSISIPFQLTAAHLGGQISNYTIESFSLINSAAGIKISKKINTNFVKKIGIAAYFCTYNDLTETKGLPYNNGHAFYPTGTLTYKYGEIMAGYWNSSDFFAPKGSSLFYSISDYKDQYYSQRRQILTTKFTFSRTLMKHVKFGLLAESYYDLDASALEYSYGVNLVFTPNFFITKINFE
ncbi:hypothetical protein [Saccharicrinis fermentans]|uniref:hypothetical protein n=1 Tax=Saccharicrinis fermentans TaxID=982 RepID=UPI0004893835|nr:hypothetical protein [Saccharicrinis fermentans]